MKAMTNSNAFETQIEEMVAKLFRLERELGNTPEAHMARKLAEGLMGGLDELVTISPSWLQFSQEDPLYA